MSGAVEAVGGLASGIINSVGYLVTGQKQTPELPPPPQVPEAIMPPSSNWVQQRQDRLRGIDALKQKAGKGTMSNILTGTGGDTSLSQTGKTLLGQ